MCLGDRKIRTGKGLAEPRYNVEIKTNRTVTISLTRSQRHFPLVYDEIKAGKKLKNVIVQSLTADIAEMQKITGSCRWPYWFLTAWRGKES